MLKSVRNIFATSAYARRETVVFRKHKANPRLSPIGRSVLAGLKEMAAHRRGELNIPARSYNISGSVDVAGVRAKAGRLTQEEFPRRYGFNLRTPVRIRPRRTPAPIRAYLLVMAEAPVATERALEYALKNTA